MLNEMKEMPELNIKSRGDTPNWRGPQFSFIWRKKKVRRIALANNKSKGKKKEEPESDYGSELPGDED